MCNHTTGNLVTTVYKPAGNQSYISDLDTSHRQFETHPRKHFIINELWSSKWNKHKPKIKNKVCTKNLKEILDQENKSINMNNYEHPTGTHAMTFHKPAGEANLYVVFEYSPQTVFKHTEKISSRINEQWSD